MATQINSIRWPTNISKSDRPVLRQVLDLPRKDLAIQHRKNDYNSVLSDISSKNSQIYSQKLKQSLLESKKAFLNLSYEDSRAEESSTMEEKSIILSTGENKKNQAKKICYKIKKTSSLYRKNQNNQPKTTTISANTVSELTKKFNQMVKENNAILEAPKFRMLVKRVNSIKPLETEVLSDKNSVKLTRKPSKVSRKPSLRTKPVLDEKKFVIITKPTVIRKVSIKKLKKPLNDNKVCVKAKIGYLESPHTVPNVDEQKPQRPSTLDIKKEVSNDLDASPSTTVKATIEIFERKTSTTTPVILNNPQPVPEKKFIETNISPILVAKNEHVSSKVSREMSSFLLQMSEENKEPLPILPPKPIIPEKKVSLSPKKVILKPLKPVPKIEDKPEKTENNSETKTEEVQIINIPAILPTKRCESMYETNNLRKLIPPLVKISKSESSISKTEEILSRSKETLLKTEEIKSRSEENKFEEISSKSEEIKPNSSFLWSKKETSPCTPYKTVEIVSSGDHHSVYDSVIIRSYGSRELSSKESPAGDLTNEVHKDIVNLISRTPDIPPRPGGSLYKTVTPSKILKKKMPLPDEKIYEELSNSHSAVKDCGDCDSMGYEYCGRNYDELVNKNMVDDDGYEYCASPNEVTENIYEMLPPPIPPPLAPKTSHIQSEPLPPRPTSSSSSFVTQNSEAVSNCYESIYTADSDRMRKIETESNYESIYGCRIREGSSHGSSGSNRDSILSEQHTNSLYGRSIGNFCIDSIYNGSKANSDLSVSDRSDDWEDVTDNEDDVDKTPGIIIVRGKPKTKKAWFQHIRDARKSPRQLSPDIGVDSDSDHHYESLCTSQKGAHYEDGKYIEYDDSFESDTESDTSFSRVNLNDSGLDIGHGQLPDPPNGQIYGLTKLAATAGKHMRKLRRNWSLTKNDITKSISKMTKRKSRTDLNVSELTRKESKEEKTIYVIAHAEPPQNIEYIEHPPYQNVEANSPNLSLTENKPESGEKTKSLSKKGFLNKFRRSMSMSTENASELTNNLNKPKSTFYLTETIDVDIENAEEANPDSGISLSPVPNARGRNSIALARPQSPPPPAPPIKNDLKKVSQRASSWYAEAGLFRNDPNNAAKRPNTFWYAEVGLYNTQNSTPSTSSAENSGSTNNIIINKQNSINNNNNMRKIIDSNIEFINNEKNEDYYYSKNNNDYYNASIHSFSSADTKKDDSLTNQNLHLQLQDEPLYQFYDAAISESSEFDSDNYEEVEKHEIHLSPRPTAMELVSPRNSVIYSRTLWCEIPEVVNSSVLSTLSGHQKKIQEAKFEMLTSEASYLNSLNVLINHFSKSLQGYSNLISPEEINILFGKVQAVRHCSEKLLQDLEKCWQDNILLTGICDIVQKHADENFSVYISYCENQILIDDTLKRLKEKPGFVDILKTLEGSITCQSLTLYSFLMLPMQRITRWPLLVDAVLKRLHEQDSEYLNCQCALETLSKIVHQCNEAARTKERENELIKISRQLEFPKGTKPIELESGSRWLVRSGMVTQMQTRTDETKLTFGKKFLKVPLHLFLFNDMLFITKLKRDNLYTVVHYCPRNVVELNTSEVLMSLPIKDGQGKHLIYMTILANQDEKTIEFMLSCSSVSDKERWIEAFTPPQSENPDEKLYECWDCPQVIAVHNYIAKQPDELPVIKGDVINVLRKMTDGWYHGERVKDGKTGWFPGNYTEEIANTHVKARHLKQRHRLLTFSENYLKAK